MPGPETPSTIRFDWRVVRELPSFVRLYWRLFREPRVSVFAKVLLLLAILYVLLPFDLLPDVLPFVGQVDDLFIFLAACRAFMYLCPRDVVREHVQRIGRERA